MSLYYYSILGMALVLRWSWSDLLLPAVGQQWAELCAVADTQSPCPPQHGGNV